MPGVRGGKRPDLGSVGVGQPVGLSRRSVASAVGSGGVVPEGRIGAAERGVLTMGTGELCHGCTPA